MTILRLGCKDYYKFRHEKSRLGVAYKLFGTDSIEMESRADPNKNGVRETARKSE